MIMRQTNQIDPRQVMEVDGGIGYTGPCDAGTEMDMVSCVEEILHECSDKMIVCLFVHQE